MAIRVQAGFDFARIGRAVLRVTESTGPQTFTVIFDASGVSYAQSDGATGLTSISASTTYAHESMETVMGTGNYRRFSTVLESALEAASAAIGNARNYTVTYSTTTHAYTIAVTGDTIAMSFTAPDAVAGERMRRVLGFAGNTSAASSSTGTRRPYYLVLPSSSSRSRVQRDYEQGGLITGAISADGSHYAIAPSSLPVLYDLTFEFESQPAATVAGAGTAVYEADATTTVPWSWQALYEHVRAHEPILIADGSESTVHYLRPDSAHFSPQRRQIDWDMWDVTLATYLEGRL